MFPKLSHLKSRTASRRPEVVILGASLAIFATLIVAIAIGVRYPIALSAITAFSAALLFFSARSNAIDESSRALAVFGALAFAAIAAAHVLDLADLVSPRGGEAPLLLVTALAVFGGCWLIYIDRRKQTLPHVWAWTTAVAIAAIIGAQPICEAILLPGHGGLFKWPGWFREISPVLALVWGLLAWRESRLFAPRSAQLVLATTIALLTPDALPWEWFGSHNAEYLRPVSFGPTWALVIGLFLWSSRAEWRSWFNLRGLPAGVFAVNLIAIATGRMFSVACIVCALCVGGWWLFGQLVRQSDGVKVWLRTHLGIRSALAHAALAALLILQFFIYLSMATKDYTAPDILQLVEEKCPGIVPESLFVQALMTDVYLWADQGPPSVVRNASYRNEGLQALAHERLLDRWSRISFEPLPSSTKRRDLGIAFQLGADSAVSFIDPDSPAAEARIQRGDRLLKVNGSPISSATLDDAYYTLDKGGTIAFKVKTRDGRARDVKLSLLEYDFKAVLVDRVLPGKEGPVGYLALRNFEGEPSEISTALEGFRKAGAHDLILDLRMNRGGKLRVASALVELLTGLPAPEYGFIRVAHNPRNIDLDDRQQPGFLVSRASPLRRVAVITSPDSCSASEALIVALRPYVDLITVGGTTCGKPVGGPWYEFRDRSYYVMGFRVIGGGASGYFHGIAADCPAKDDLTHDLGDPEEASVKTALAALRTGGCRKQGH